ncbi:hypothetical protein OG747_51990 (plasmid) [Streptomyces sp. NBC_01384]
MRPFLQKVPAIEDDDPVGGAGGAEPVGDQDNRAVAIATRSREAPALPRREGLQLLGVWLERAG